MNSKVNLSAIAIAIGIAASALFAPCANANSPGEIVPQNPTVELLSEGYSFKFLEGPAWSGSLLYFTDIQGNSIYRYTSDTIEAINTNSNLSNGLLFHREKEHLLVCVGGAGHVASISPQGIFTDTLAGEFHGKPFNSPNDLIMDHEGGIYFTDPTWAQEYPQPIKGVYYINTKGDITLLVEDLDKPNGIILSPDQQTLYINDSHSTKVLAFDIDAPGAISNRRVFAELDMGDIQGNISGADGMAMDTQGNLYVTFRRGVQTFTPNGDSFALIPLPETATNCTFGGSNLGTLFITAGKNLYSIDLNTEGVRW